MEDFVSRLVCTYAIFFELVFSMTASSECRVSRVFSAFMLGVAVLLDQRSEFI